EWHALEDPQLGPRRFPQDLIEVQLELDGEYTALPQTRGWEPHIRLGNTGEMTPAVITLRVAGSELRREIEVTLARRVEVRDATRQGGPAVGICPARRPRAADLAVRGPGGAGQGRRRPCAPLRLSAGAYPGPLGRPEPADRIPDWHARCCRRRPYRGHQHG